MADVEDGRSVAASEGSGGMNMDEETGIDVDFGAIEIFDSNTAPTLFSSGAPEAVMTEDAAVHSSSKKTKRDKKDKKDKKRRKSEDGAGPSSSAPEQGDATAKKHRKPKSKSIRDVQVPDSQPSNEKAESAAGADTPCGQLQQEASAVVSPKANNKRKLSHSADGKRRKKQGSRSQESAGPADKEGHHGSQEASATSFLLKNKDRQGVPESAIYEDNEPESDPQASPTVAHLRRRSQSREARSRENSIPRSAQMDVDAADTSAGGQHATDAAIDAEYEAERIAREAWDEHRNGQTGRDEMAHGDYDTEMPDQYPQAPLSTGAAGEADMTAEAQLTSPQPKNKRSSKKKAKPTYFERPSPDILVDEDNQNGLAELPSPSAMSPKPRNRKKRAAKKESRGRKPKKEKKLSQSMRGGSVDAQDVQAAAAAAAAERRNRLTGYTQGRFSDAELARISRAVEGFRADNGLTQPEVNELIHAPGGTTAGETNAQLWTRIFAECPDRHRQKVINITRKKFHNFVARGTWTPEQDAELAELIGIHGTKWSVIASLINRHPEDLRDRYRNYIVCGANQRKDAWDEDEEARLTQYIMESMRAIDVLRANEPSRAILQKSYEELIDWQDISERMDRTRSRLQCITKWKSLNIRTHGRDRLVSTQPDSQISFRLEKARRQIAVMPSEERYRLVSAVEGTAVSTDIRIPWQKLVDKPFRNRWHRYTQMLLWRRLKATVPNPTKITVLEAAQYLVDLYKQNGDLPDVPDELFDDADEMDFIQAIAPIIPIGFTQAQRAHMSSEFVTESDVEDEDRAEQYGGAEAGAEGGAEASHGDVGEQNQAQPQLVQEEDLKIDPALAEAGPTTTDSRLAKRGGKTPGSQKRSRKALRDVDPIEDDVMQEAEQAQDSGSEVDVGSLRRKKTPSKFQSPQGIKPDEQLLPDDDDSVMDDMEDLPAVVPAEVPAEA
ncbi:hypothetical protein E4U42_004642 [Claviceps africana]|uniref:Myb transcription factor n=1 Tax=Claviceps africana TaxID=83212 RepID=A0A8K0NI18_9HYPO|nr:hypothetical protein E4U42_004642 [Claviceps africana]